MACKPATELVFCVSCGGKLHHTPAGYIDHACSDRSVAAKEGANTRAWEPIIITHSVGQRLIDGNNLLDMGGD